MTKRTISIPKLAKQIPDETAAYEYMEGLRWPNGPVCPHCQNRKAYFLTPKGEGRKTRTGTVSVRRVWKCAKCRKQFSVLTGTIFHGTKIDLRTWLFVVFEMCASKNGVSAREIERKYELTPKTAWFMTHRIREAMRRDPFSVTLRGTIIADETYIGGDAKNRHAKDRDGTTGRGASGKIPVFSLIHRETGEVRSRVIPDVSGMTLRKAIEEHVDPFGSVLHTDGWSGYRPVGRQFDAHEVVDHNDGEYVRGEVTTNHVEGYFSQLQRSIDGTHHQVSRDHLDRYLAEFDFRHSTRKLDDTARMERLMGQTGGRRLAYRPLVG